jgi:branched-subunit amino acid aminotransferase/4-amino-4-deoxychorismate lyase
VSWGRDPALTLGLSVFETMALHPSGALLDLAWHLERLERSARWLGAPLPERAQLQERLLSTAREVADAHKRAQRHHNTHELLALRYTLSVSGREDLSTRTYPRAEVGGLKRVALLWAPPSPYLPRWVKHSSRAEWRLAAHAMGVDEALLCEGLSGGVEDQRWGEGALELLEGDLSGLCLLREGALICPPQDELRLASVGLRRLRGWAEALGAPVEEQRLILSELREGDALLLTSSLKGPCLVSELRCVDPRLLARAEEVKGLKLATSPKALCPKSLALWAGLLSSAWAYLGADLGADLG